MDVKKKYLLRVRTSVKDLAKSFKTSITKLKSHMENQARAAYRDGFKKEKADEKSLAQDIKAKAKRAAEQAKTSMIKDDPLFALDFVKLIADTKVLAIAEVASDATPSDFDTPWMHRAPRYVTSWKMEAKVQTVLSNYAAEYKKQDSCKASGRAQYPMAVKEGKEQTDEMFSAAMSPGKDKTVDMKTVPTGNTATNTAWMYGCMSKMASASLTPFGLAMGRVMLHGKIRVLLFDVLTLKEAFKQDCRKNETMDDLTKNLLDEGSDGLLKLIGHGAKVYYGLQNPDDLLYVPAGFIHADFPEGTLIYGARKSFAFASTQTVARYDVCTSMHSAAGKPVDKMRAVAAKLAEATRALTLGTN